MIKRLKLAIARNDNEISIANNFRSCQPQVKIFVVLKPMDV